MIWPIVASLLAEILPTCAIMSPVTGFENLSSSPFMRSPVFGRCRRQIASTAFSIPRFMSHGIGTGGDGPDAFTIDGLSQNGRSCRTVAGNVGRFAGDFANHLSAYVLKAVLEFNLFRNGDAVLGDRWGSELFLDDYVATSGARVTFTASANKLTPRKIASGLFSVYDLLCHDFYFLL